MFHCEMCAESLTFPADIRAGMADRESSPQGTKQGLGLAKMESANHEKCRLWDISETAGKTGRFKAVCIVFCSH